MRNKTQSARGVRKPRKSQGKWAGLRLRFTRIASHRTTFAIILIYCRFVVIAQDYATTNRSFIPPLSQSRNAKL